MLPEIIEDFRTAKTWGVKVLVLPEGHEAMESDLLAAALQQPTDPATMIVGVSPAKALPLHSVRDAIVGGYMASKGKPGLFAAVGTYREQIADIVGGVTMGVFGWLTKTALHKLTNTPISRLREPPYTQDDIAVSLKELCSGARVALCVRRAYKDNEASLKFLSDTCGDKLEQLLGDDRRNLLVIVFMRASDMAGEIGIALKESADEADDVQIIEVEAEGEADTERELTKVVRGATPDVISVVRHVALYTEAADTEVFPLAVIREACRLRDSKPLDWLVAKGVLNPIGGEGETAVWGLGERYDRWDFAIAADELASDDDEVSTVELMATDASEALTDKNDEADGLGAGTVLTRAGEVMVFRHAYERGGTTYLVYRTGDGTEKTVPDQELVKQIKKGTVTPASADQVAALGELAGGEDESEREEVLDWRESAANRLFVALWEATGSEDEAVPILLNLAYAGTLIARAAELTGRHVAQLVDRQDFVTLRARLRWLCEFFQSHIADQFEPSEREVATAVDGLTGLLAALERGQERPWGAEQGYLSDMALILANQIAAGHLGDELLGRGRTLVRGNAAYLLLLTDAGRMKLVSLRAEGMDVMGRGYSGTPCVADAERDGTLSECHVVRPAQDVWLLYSNGVVMQFPLRGLDAVHRRDPAGVFENMAACLDLRYKWEQAEDRLVACSPYVGECSPGDLLVLVNEAGQAFAVPASALPQATGEKRIVETRLLSRNTPARWAVLLTPQDELFVATNGNQILRLAHADIAATAGHEINSLMRLDEGTKLAAVAAVAEGDSPELFVVTVRGYGRRVPAHEFPLGNVGGKGVVGQKLGKRSGSICSIEAVPDFGDFLIATTGGNVARVARDAVPARRRANVGLKLVAMDEGDTVACACSY